MAHASLPEPGSKYGPCLEGCEHIDCAATRKQAAQLCRICGEQIGYQQNFYSDPQKAGELVHAVCLWKEIDEKQAK